MARMKTLTAKVETDPQFKTPHRIYDIETKASKQSPQKIAASILKKIAGDLKIRPDLSQLKFDKVKESILGSHVLYQQYHAGKPISGAWIRVDIDKDGRVFNILSDLVPEPAMAKTRMAEARRAGITRRRQLSEGEADARAIEAAVRPRTVGAGPGSGKSEHNAIAFRCPGLHGDRHSRREGHD